MLINPVSPQELKGRNTILQDSLRPGNLPFTIQEEYPIVLAPRNSCFSQCLKEDDQVVAHANLWPRKLVDANGNTAAKIGLIGNVATHRDFRGRGLMKKLLALLEAKAILEDLEALILWSDLNKFYQNLGYESLAQEWHYYFHPKKASSHPRFSYIAPADIHVDLTKSLATLRFPTEYTLDRDTDEFFQLLHIPNTYLFIQQTGTNIDSYFIIGKGYDMQGVVHEWGGWNIDSLVDGITIASGQLNYNEIRLLAPGSIKKKLRKRLDKFAFKRERLPMALCKFLTASQNPIDALSRSFIWGLDSI